MIAAEWNCWQTEWMWIPNTMIGNCASSSMYGGANFIPATKTGQVPVDSRGPAAHKLLVWYGPLLSTGTCPVFVAGMKSAPPYIDELAQFPIIVFGIPLCSSKAPYQTYTVWNISAGKSFTYTVYSLTLTLTLQGGLVATDVAVRHQELFTGLILSAPSVELDVGAFTVSWPCTRVLLSPTT